MKTRKKIPLKYSNNAAPVPIAPDLPPNNPKMDTGIITPVKSTKSKQKKAAPKKSKVEKSSTPKAPKDIDQEWEMNYQLLVKYKAKHGNCNVSADIDLPLAQWRTYQLIQKDALTKYQRSKLSALGFRFTARIQDRLRFECMYAKLVEYHAQHGDCLVPARWGKLGKWVSRQRESHSWMPDDRRAKLNALGFVWRVVGQKKTKGKLLALQKEQELKYKNKPQAPAVGQWEYRLQQVSVICQTGAHWDPYLKQWLEQQIDWMQRGLLSLIQQQQLLGVLRNSGIPIPPPGSVTAGLKKEDPPAVKTAVAMPTATTSKDAYHEESTSSSMAFGSGSYLLNNAVGTRIERASAATTLTRNALKYATESSAPAKRTVSPEGLYPSGPVESTGFVPQRLIQAADSTSTTPRTSNCMAFNGNKTYPEGPYQPSPTSTKKARTLTYLKPKPSSGGAGDRRFPATAHSDVTAAGQETPPLYGMPNPRAVVTPPVAGNNLGEVKWAAQDDVDALLWQLGTSSSNTCQVRELIIEAEVLPRHPDEMRNGTQPDKMAKMKRKRAFDKKEEARSFVAACSRKLQQQLKRHGKKRQRMHQ